MKKIVLLLFCLCCACPALAAGQAPLAGDTASPASSPSAAQKQKKPAPARPGKEHAVPRANARTLGEGMDGSAWYIGGQPRGAKGSVWEKGVPLNTLARKHTVQKSPASGAQAAGVDTKQAIDSALKDLSEYERQPADGSALGLSNRGVHGKVSSDTASWRNPVTEPVRVGEEVVMKRRNVVGAYADVVQSEDLQVTVGPELHIPETESTKPNLTSKQGEGSSLGVGMQFQWGF